VKRILSASLLTILIGLSAACGDDGPAAGTGGGSGDGTGSGSGSGRQVKACDLYTLDDAKKVIGPEAEAAPNNGSADTTMGDISVTLCGYSDPSGNHYASVLVRSSGTESGKSNNEQAFTSARAASATDVAGYGDKAYYDAAQGQLTVLSKGTYLIFSNGRGLDPKKHTLADAQKVADVVLPDL
jgi:hypothetical protein